MAFYLVQAKLKKDRINELENKLIKDEFKHLQPFGKALTYSLANARLNQNGLITWEEEDYCNPPLAEEKAAVLNQYFTNITLQNVQKGEGWKTINNLPKLFSF